MSLQRFRNKLQRGFTLLELILATSVVAVTSGILVDRFLVYQEMAERVSVLQTVRALRVSLQLQVANLIAKNRVDELPLLAEQNPMQWLAQPPDNYVGVVAPERQRSVVSGHWYFDPSGKKLVYLVHNGANFRSESGRAKEIVYRTRLLYSQAERGLDEAGAIEGVVLEEVNTFEWFNQSFSLEAYQK